MIIKYVIIILIMFYHKYLKYKKKYLDLKLKGGADGVCVCGRPIYGRHCGDKCCKTCTGSERPHTPECEKLQEKIEREKSKLNTSYLILEITEYEEKNDFLEEKNDSFFNGSIIFIASFDHREGIDFSNDYITYKEKLLHQYTDLEHYTEIFGLSNYLRAKIQFDGGTTSFIVRMAAIKGKIIDDKIINIGKFSNEITEIIGNWITGIPKEVIQNVMYWENNGKLKIDALKEVTKGIPIDTIIRLSPKLEEGIRISMALELKDLYDNQFNIILDKKINAYLRLLIFTIPKSDNLRDIIFRKFSEGYQDIRAHITSPQNKKEKEILFHTAEEKKDVTAEWDLFIRGIEEFGENVKKDYKYIKVETIKKLQFEGREFNDQDIYVLFTPKMIEG